MKTFAVFVLLTTVVWGVERDELHRLLAEAAGAQGEEYLAVRGKLREKGDEVLPLLREAAEDGSLTWQQRLVARIAFERLQRDDEIKALQFHNWGAYPPYQRAREEFPFQPAGHLGVAGSMGPYVVPKLKEAGVWYYYVEQNWKTMFVRRERGVIGSYGLWPRWCRQALEGEPEEIYLWMAIADRIEKEEGFLESYDNRLLYAELIARRVKYAVPILLGKWEEFLKNHFTPYEAFPGSRTITLRSYVSDIVAMADPTHAEAMERFISQREELFGVFRSQLEEVRKREPVKVQEPPFWCEKKPPLEGMKEPPPGFFDPPKPPEPQPADTSPQDIVIEVN